MKKQNIIIIVLILIIILLIATGIVFFTTNNRKTENIVPDTANYTYLVQTSIVLDTEKKENHRVETIYIFDDKDIFTNQIRETNYKKEEHYLTSKPNYSEDVKELKAHSKDEENTTVRCFFDDTNYRIVELIKFRYNELNTKEEIIKWVEQQENVDSEYLITTHKIY